MLEYALMKPQVVKENVVLGVVILQDISQRFNRLGGRHRVLPRAKRGRRERWGGEQVIQLVVLSMESLFNCGHLWSCKVNSSGASSQFIYPSSHVFVEKWVTIHCDRLSFSCFRTNRVMNLTPS